MSFFNTYFSPVQLVGLVGGLIFVVTTLVFHVRKWHKLSFVTLCLAALGLYWFAANLDPFLNIWDERFHALVAKNLRGAWYKPTLFLTQPFDVGPVDWANSHIWLHKQPLFLWQMALCIGLFGVNEVAIRMPDVLLGVAMVSAVYRSGWILINRNVGLYAALFALTAPFCISLISGRQMTDHNDFIFVAYVTFPCGRLLNINIREIELGSC